MVRAPSRSRREVIRLAAASGPLAIAGCIGIGAEDTPAVEEFGYSDGFSPDEIRLERAVGERSAMAARESLAVESDRLLPSQGAEIEMELEEAHSATDRRFLSRSVTHNSAAQRTTVRSGYFDSEELIERQKVQPESVEYSYRAREYQMNAVEEYRLSELRGALRDVDVEATDVIEPEGDVLAVYTAETGDFGPESLVAEWSELFGELSEGRLELHADESGLIPYVHFEAEFSPVGEDPVPTAVTWEYSNFDDTPVDEPDWLAEVPGLERPEVGLTIDETAGEGIEIEIDTIEHTDVVVVVIEGEGVFEERTQPGIVEVPHEAYTTQEGVQQVMVFAGNELRGPILIESHWPEPAS